MKMDENGLKKNLFALQRDPAHLNSGCQEGAAFIFPSRA